jgi:flavorubredoxin
MLGAGIDARLGLQDYSGFTNAAAIQAQGMQNLGASIGQAVEAYQANKKEASQMSAQVKASENFLTSAKTVFGNTNPELSTMIDNALAISSDPKMSLTEKTAFLGSAAQNLETLMAGITTMQETDLRKQQLGLQQQAMQQRAGAAGSAEQAAEVIW